EVRVGENVKKVSFGTGSSIIETGNDKIHAKMVIGADGTASTVAKSLGLKWSNDELVILSQKELSDVYETDEDIIDVFYGENVSSNTYAAIYPKSNGNVSFGLGEKMGVNVKAKMDELSDNHPVISKYLRNSKTSVYARGIVPVFNKGRKSYGSCYLLAGDAAGQVNPHTGEGIEYAMLCGQMAGKVSGYAAKSGDFSEKKLKDYENMWGKEFGWQFRLAKMMRVPVSDRLLNKQSKIFRENDALRKIMAETLDEGRYSVMITKSLISPKALYGLIRMMI
ncbi:MAG: FAD-dependent monooxygenase, partial [Candidatus Methanofastidiosia archaeon]